MAPRFAKGRSALHMEDPLNGGLGYLYIDEASINDVNAK